MSTSATVGTLKVLLQADTAAFTAAMASATADVQKIGAALQKDLEPRQRAVNAAVRDFLGTDEIRKAQEYIAAVTKIGDVSNLTEANQRKLGRAVSDAIDQYRALGQKVPADMQAVYDATRKAEGSSTSFTKSLSSVTGGLKSMAGLLGIGIGAGALVGFGKSVFDAASKIHDMSSALGLSAEAYQRFTYAAEQSGGSAEAFEKAIQRMNDGLASGDKSTVEALKAAGLGLDAIRAMKPEEAFTAISDAVGKIEDPMTRAKVAQDLFGKGALQLLPGMIEGYKKLGEAATVMSNDTVDRLEAAQDAWDDLWKKITVVSGEMIASAMNVTKTYTAEQRQLAIDLAIIANQARGGGDAMDFLAEKLKHVTKVTADTHIVFDVQKHDVGEVTEAEKAHQKALQALADTYTGTALQQKVKDIAAAYDLARKQGGLLAQQLPALSHELQAIRDAGGTLPSRLNAIADAFSRNAQVIQRQLKPVLIDWSMVDDGTRSINDLSLAFYRNVGSVQQGIDKLKQLGLAYRTIPDNPPIFTPTQLQRFKEAALSLDGIRGLVDDIGRNMTGAGREITAAFSGAINITIQYIKALQDVKTQAEATAVASQAAMAGATFGISLMIGQVAKGYQEMKVLKQHIADTREEIIKLNETPIDLPKGKGIHGPKAGGNNLNNQADALDKQLADLQAAQQTLTDTLGRYGLSLDDVGTASEKLSRDSQRIATDFTLLSSKGFSLQQITKGASSQLNGLIASALQTGVKLPSALQPYIEQLVRSGGLTDDLKNKILGIADPVPWQDMEAAAGRYNISLDALGKGFQQAKLDDQVKTLVSDWELFATNGADVNAVMDGMKESVQKVLDNASKFGTLVPASMKPMLEAMAKAGKLTDDQGNALSDLTKINFAPDLAGSFQTLIDKLDAFIDKITGPGGLADSLGNLPTPHIDWPTPPDYSSSSSGGSGSDNNAPGTGAGTPPGYPGAEPAPPGYAVGGYIPSTPGGKRITVAEAGYGETVLPGNWSNLLDAARRMPNWDGAMAGIYSGGGMPNEAPSAGPMSLNVGVGDVVLDGNRVGSVLWKPMVKDLQRRQMTPR